MVCGTIRPAVRRGAAMNQRRDHGRQMLSGEHDRGYLPHFKREGATYFVTFRLDGTLPQDVLEQFGGERAELERRAGDGELRFADWQRIKELYAERIDAYLDAGRGACWLNRPDVARLVCDALRYFDGQRYELHPWVVMPNHVHALLTPRGSHSLSQILQSIKSYTGNRANRLIDRAGQAFWQPESYDHVVRDERQFAAYGEYIVNNPATAWLCARLQDWPYSSAYVPPQA